MTMLRFQMQAAARNVATKIWWHRKQKGLPTHVPESVVRSLAHEVDPGVFSKASSFGSTPKAVEDEIVQAYRTLPAGK